jgi:tetratricopeptide (TPR) repeat protein
LDCCTEKYFVCCFFVGSLSKVLDNNEWYQYAALCREAMARCAHISSNSPGEAEAWAEAGRMFLKAESVYCSASAPSYEDGIHAAVHCFNLAIQAHKNIKNFSLAAKFALEIASVLKSLEKFGDAQLFYERASILQQEMIEAYLHSMEQVALCQLRQFNYDGALKTVTQLKSASTKSDGNKEFAQRIEITQLLLLLILRPSEFFMSSEHQDVLDLYQGDVCVYAGPVQDAELVILLQSLCFSAKSKHIKEISSLKQGLWPYFTLDQQELFEVLERLVRSGGRF